MKLGNLILDNPVMLAPMAGVTDSAFRKLCRKYGADVTVSEMVSSKGIFYGDKKKTSEEIKRKAF